MRRLFGCPDTVSLTEKFLMARNFFWIFSENNPVMGYSKTFFIPEAKGLTPPIVSNPMAIFILISFWCVNSNTCILTQMKFFNLSDHLNPPPRSFVLFSFVNSKDDNLSCACSDFVIRKERLVYCLKCSFSTPPTTWVHSHIYFSSSHLSIQGWVLQVCLQGFFDQNKIFVKRLLRVSRLIFKTLPTPCIHPHNYSLFNEENLKYASLYFVNYLFRDFVYWHIKWSYSTTSQRQELCVLCDFW